MMSCAGRSRGVPSLYFDPNSIVVGAELTVRSAKRPSYLPDTLRRTAGRGLLNGGALFHMNLVWRTPFPLPGSYSCPNSSETRPGVRN